MELIPSCREMKWKCPKSGSFIILYFADITLFGQVRLVVFSATVEIFFGQGWLSPLPRNWLVLLWSGRRLFSISLAKEAAGAANAFWGS